MTVENYEAATDIKGGFGLVGLAALNLTISLVFASGVLMGLIVVVQEGYRRGEMKTAFFGLIFLAVNSLLTFLFAGVGFTAFRDFFKTRLMLSKDSLFDNRFMKMPLQWEQVKSVTIVYNKSYRPYALKLQTDGQSLPMQSRLRIGCSFGQRPNTSMISLFGLSVAANFIVAKVRDCTRERDIDFVDPHSRVL